MFQNIYQFDTPSSRTFRQVYVLFQNGDYVMMLSFSVFSVAQMFYDLVGLESVLKLARLSPV
jgi:hypothetical protein